MREVSKADWRVFREVREHALERYCERVLEEVQTIAEKGDLSWHDRYLRAYRLLQDRDESLADAFDNPRRSQMLFQLAAMQSLGIVEEGELARFSDEVRETITVLLEGFS